MKQYLIGVIYLSAQWFNSTSLSFLYISGATVKIFILSLSPASSPTIMQETMYKNNKKKTSQMKCHPVLASQESWHSEACPMYKFLILTDGASHTLPTAKGKQTFIHSDEEVQLYILPV